MKRRIGILGGTFDPVHSTHIKLARLAGEQFSLDEVWLMPTGDPPHKADKQITPAFHRLRMLQLAVEEEQDSLLQVSAFELEREGRIYTADTLTLLSESHPDVQWFFILGGDSLLYLERWYHPEVIFHHATILATVRNQAGLKELLIKRDQLQTLYPEAKIEFVQMGADTLSSSLIRELLAKEHRTDEESQLLQSSLAATEYQYIVDKGLYVS